VIFGKRDAKPRVILASTSPRRAEILHHAGLRFEIHASPVNETRLPRESAHNYVARLAATKARHAANHFKRKGTRGIVIGADTAVVAEGKILGKPSDVRDARRMLRLLSGRSHTVLTGICLIKLPIERESHHVESTRVRFRKLSAKQIDDYIATGEPFGKAGAYAIQGIAGRYITRIEGCYFNVMGFPLSRFWQMLEACE
jgi:septum formation protein